MSVGEGHTGVVTKSGYLYTFGDGRHGKLCHGDDNFSTLHSPHLVESFRWDRELGVGYTRGQRAGSYLYRGYAVRCNIGTENCELVIQGYRCNSYRDTVASTRCRIGNVFFNKVMYDAQSHSLNYTHFRSNMFITFTQMVYSLYHVKHPPLDMLTVLPPPVQLLQCKAYLVVAATPWLSLDRADLYKIPVMMRLRFPLPGQKDR